MQNPKQFQCLSYDSLLCLQTLSIGIVAFEFCNLLRFDIAACHTFVEHKADNRLGMLEALVHFLLDIDVNGKIFEFNVTKEEMSPRKKHLLGTWRTFNCNE